MAKDRSLQRQQQRIEAKQQKAAKLYLAQEALCNKDLRARKKLGKMSAYGTPPPSSKAVQDYLLGQREAEGDEEAGKLLLQQYDLQCELEEEQKERHTYAKLDSAVKDAITYNVNRNQELKQEKEGFGSKVASRKEKLGKIVAMRSASAKKTVPMRQASKCQASKRGGLNDAPLAQLYDGKAVSPTKEPSEYCRK